MNNPVERTLVYVSLRHQDSLIGFLVEHGWNVVPAKTAVDVSRRIQSTHTASVALIDLSSGYTETDLHSFEQCMQFSRLGWVAITAPDQMADAAVHRFVRDYCFDYLSMPCPEVSVSMIVGHAYGMASLHGATNRVVEVPGSKREMVGTCEAMQQLFRTISRFSASNAPVFIFGESGTGKELTAMAIHEDSACSKKPFVAINCGAISQALMQSELFGYERGAFTGANQRKIGRVEAANGGTLFLDEIGDLPMESQAGLLRFLQQGSIERLGGHEAISVNVRIISATNVDLEKAVQEGRFRMDLYHRLCVLRVVEPPLRDRGHDIEILANHFLEHFKGDNRHKIRGFTRGAVQAMHEYRWPGNVRELSNRVRRAIVMTDSRMVSARDLDLPHEVHAPARTLEQTRADAERHAIASALLRHSNRPTEVAKELGISRVTLYRLMCRHGLREAGEATPAA